MASLVFNTLAPSSQITVNKHLYADLHLDFKNPIKRDVSVDYDLAAINNSIVNLFNTMPGQNLLNPDYGLNLLQYLFEPASDVIAQLIGDRIFKGIKVYEPRVTISGINVEVNIDEQMYTVTLSMVIPSLNSNISITGALTKNGFNLL
jgi:phage baseplate assembly protein W